MPSIDLAKRRRIMQRSMKLGHCICDPKRPCPCDVFTEQGLCPCAGERPEPIDLSQVKLTELVHNAGCASKIPPGDLEAVLGRLPEVDDAAVLSGIPAGDDAGVYALSGDVTLVQTVDVFTPCVDDPETFGRICAANCLSDIYAMGGTPRTALSILAFPSESLDARIMFHMLKGAMDVLAEAECSLIGGHSIKDEEIKLGFAITGTIPRGRAVERHNARVGDVLVLTKPLGTGVLSFARQVDRVGAEALEAPSRSMQMLNRAAAEAMKDVGVHACTDVTGFGLYGHLIGMCRTAGVTAQVYADALPAFDGAVDLLADGVIPGAIERNREFVAQDIAAADGLDAARVLLGFDAQTSGGLLMAVPADRHKRVLAALSKRGVEGHTIGRIAAESDGKIAVTAAGQDLDAAPLREIVDEPPHAAGPRPGADAASCCSEAQPKSAAGTSCCGSSPSQPARTEDEMPCCGDAFGQEPAAANGSTAGDSLAAFGSLMRSTGTSGAVDERTKELINFALVVLARCEPCLAVHVQRARKMGISDAELQEVAWCAVAMGGAPVRMFYQEALARL
jgi:selenide,water dikinase